MSSDTPRSNHICAGPSASNGAGAGEPESSAEFTDEASAATIAVATQALVTILIAPSPPGDLDTPVLQLGHAWIGGDRQLRLALGENLEAVRRNAASEKTFQHRRSTALRQIKVDFRAAGARSAVPVRIMTMGLPSL